MLTVNIDHTEIYRQFIDQQRKEIMALHDEIFALNQKIWNYEGRLEVLRTGYGLVCEELQKQKMLQEEEEYAFFT